LDIKITPSKLNGRITAIPSKSYAHRALICAALSDAPTSLNITPFSEDVKATLRCIEELGAVITYADSSLTVTPGKKDIRKAFLDCGESGTTARMILPAALTLCPEITLSGAGRLPERPMSELVRELRKKGTDISGDFIPLTAKGKLSAGLYEIEGNITSQYISGLLTALSAINEKSEIRLLSPAVSMGYIDMTLEVLKKFGARTEKKENGFIINPSLLKSPGSFTVEGDWSNAAFFVAANSMGNEIEINNLNPESLQKDSRILHLTDCDLIDGEDIPDIVPILSVAAAAKKGETKIINVSRLKLKESDRLCGTKKMLEDLGGKVEITDDTITVFGKGYLDGGTSDSINDHRIAMCLAIASTICRKEVIITNAQAVNKSYPGFFEDFNRLGGKADVIHNG